MAHDMTPATKADLSELKQEVKADLQGMEKRILKAIADLSDMTQRQFDFVSEELTKVLDRLNGIDKQLQDDRNGILSAVHDFVAEDHAAVTDHARRIKRLEQHVGIAA